MEIHVHSTLAMKEVGRKERQPRQTRHITPRPDKQDIQDIDFTNHTKIGQTNSHKYNMQHTKVNTGQKSIKGCPALRTWC